MNQLLTVKQLRELLYYDPQTGLFTRRTKIYRKGKIGAIVGTVCSSGYRKIGLNSKRYYAERLAWLYMTGEWPSNIIRHKDGSFDNNRWDNLEATTHSPTEEQNQRRSKTLTGRKLTDSHRANLRGKPAQYPRRWFYYNGIAFRSNWERLAAIKFDMFKIKWEYEARRFDLGTQTYAPDFYLPEQECFWEIKGFFGLKSKTTINLFREQYPEVPLVVANQKVLEQLGITRKELRNPSQP